MRRWLQGFHWQPTPREVVGGGLMGLVIGVLGFLIPTTSLEVVIIQMAVFIVAGIFIRWRWGEVIERWFRG